MIMACGISVREYRKEHKFLLKIDHSNSLQDEGSFAGEFIPDSDPLSPDSSDNENITLTANTTSAAPTQPQMRTLQLSKGDTLESLLLTEAGISRADVDQVIAAVQSKTNLRRIKTGQAFIVTTQAATEGQPFRLKNLEFNISDKAVLIITRTEQGTYLAKVESLSLKPVLRRIDGRIHSSFYSTAIKQGVPQNIVREAIASLTYVMNFQHGIKKGDTFEILFEEKQDRHGKTIKTGDLRYVSFTAGKTQHRIYRHINNGLVSYYDDKGRSIVKGLLQTPLDASKMRITSGFGMRLHPIKGYNKYHKGVDLGAPTGTAIKAAGDGIIVKYGYYGEYGNFVKIRHGNGYETAYGHLSRYAQGLSVGSRVKQNEVIGYVGATGSATGPHLHFEVIHNGANVNPMSVKKMPSVQLVGKDLQKFNKAKSEIDTHLVALTPPNTIAYLPTDMAETQQPVIG
ncbi:MAG: peptidoglycan DD-metalloendopeptidase family protein [Pseudomonadota bacterium]